MLISPLQQLCRAVKLMFRAILLDLIVHSNLTFKREQLEIHFSL